MTLLTPYEVDRLLRYQFGRSQRLAKRAKLPHILLPDGEVRFDQAEIEKLLATSRKGEAATPEVKRAS